MCVSKYKDKHNLHAVSQHSGSAQQYLLVAIKPSIYPSMQSCLEKALYIFRMLVQTHFIFMIHKFTSYQHEMTSFRRLKIQNVPYFPRTKSGREKKKGDRAMKSYSILDAIHIFPIISNVWIWTKINLNRMCVFAAYYLLCMWFNLRIMVNG